MAREKAGYPATAEGMARWKADRAVYASECWWVQLDEPCQGLFAVDADGRRDLVELLAVLYGMCADAPAYELAPTSDGDCAYVAFRNGCERLCAHEDFMRGLMRVLRENGCHGAYRKAGTEKEYRF